MKYIAIIDSDDELSEDAIKAIKDTVFVGDEQTPYCVDITSIKKAPEPMRNDMLGVDGFYGGYNYALRDCGVVEE